MFIWGLALDLESVMQNSKTEFFSAYWLKSAANDWCHQNRYVVAQENFKELSQQIHCDWYSFASSLLREDPSLHRQNSQKFWIDFSLKLLLFLDLHLDRPQNFLHLISNFFHTFANQKDPDLINPKFSNSSFITRFQHFDYNCYTLKGGPLFCQEFNN